MKRGQIFVRAIRPNGHWDAVDVFDLDELSFRVFVMELFDRQGAVVSLVEKKVEGDPIVLRSTK
jgi:hypothetical protein